MVFFFQAEDGIRDGTVTGVQTCALPISGEPGGLMERPHRRGAIYATVRLLPGRDRVPARGWGLAVAEVRNARTGDGAALARSEERRVGKECRSRWSRYQ